MAAGPWDQYAQAQPAAAPAGPWSQYQQQPSGPSALAASNPGEYDPNSPEWQAKYGATSGMSGADKFFAGAGKSVVDLGRGVRQLGAEAGNALGLVDDSTVAGLRAEQADVNQQDSALMKTGAGIAGNVAGTLATTLLPASLAARGAQVAGLARTGRVASAFVNPTTYKAAAAAGAVQGALQPVATGESRAKNVAIGGALGTGGQAVANTVGRIAQPLKNALSKEDKAAVAVLDKAGIPLDAAQRSGSKAAQVVKRAVADNPLTSPGQADFIEKQGTAFTKAVLNTIGENADTATPDVMGAAQSRIGKVFDDVATRNPVKYDGQLNKEIADLSSEAHKELVSQDYQVFGRQIEEIFGKATDGNGMIDGAAYQNLRTSLGRVAERRDTLGHWAGELRSTLDDALERSANKQDLADLKTARKQYRRMLQIEGAIDTEGAGKISPSKLANSLATKSNRRSSIYGKGDTELTILAKAGKKLLPDKFPNSGTTARIAGQLLAPTALGLAAGTASGDTNTGLGTALGAAGLLMGARGAMNNQLAARYLTQGLGQGAARGALQAPQRTGLLSQLAATGVPAMQQ